MNLNHLLAVDDNEQSLALIGRLAKGSGYESTLTSTAVDFKAGYLGSRPTLIVMDVLLGGEDCSGLLDFLARCRCQTPIVLVTGYTAEFMSVLESRMQKTGLKLAAKIEKKRSLYLLDDQLKSLRIPEIEDLLSASA